jgi:two-component system OmpR family response regulator
MVRVLDRGLRAHGFEVSHLDPVTLAGVDHADSPLGILIVDLGAAAPEGSTWLDQLRAAQPTLPVLVLSASASPRAGDEYLHKPFAMEELIARIRARTRGAGEPRVTTLTAGDLRLDLLARCAWRGDQLIDLPGREFGLLEYFMRHPARVLSRQAILQDVWGYDLNPASASNVVDVYVRYLRNKLDRAGAPSIIGTVRGAGYRLDAAPGLAAPLAGADAGPGIGSISSSSSRPNHDSAAPPSAITPAKPHISL